MHTRSAILALVLAPGAILAQTNQGPAPSAERPEPAAEATAHAWSLSAMVYGYIVPNDSDYAQPTVPADRGGLHLEARYNYEDRQTGSAWLGYNLSFGEELTLELTPMLGGVFGNTNGIAPGYKASLGYRRLTLYTEGEYLIDTGNSDDSFFYTWSELTYSPVEAFRFGLVIQRTKAYQTRFEIQRGLLAGFSAKLLEFTTYVFNFDGDPAVVLAAAIHFDL
jgi:hypothetical protein